MDKAERFALAAKRVARHELEKELFCNEVKRQKEIFKQKKPNYFTRLINAIIVGVKSF